MTKQRTIISVKHTGYCPVCGGELPSDRFFCSRKCMLKGNKQGIYAFYGKPYQYRPRKRKASINNSNMENK